MKVSILGDGLTSLTLAKMLVNLGISTDIFFNKKKKKNNRIQTLGISKTNIDFFNNYILNINKLLWDINSIEIFSEKLDNEKILDFTNKNNQLFSIIRNTDLYKSLFFSLKKNKLVNFKKNIDYQTLIKKKYQLIFNCNYSHTISRKYFYKKIDKDYNSYAYVTTFKHAKLKNNHTASQIFTKVGPIAFLPISSTETSVVYSVKSVRNVNLNEFIKNYNRKYKIHSINHVLKYKLNSSNLRSYYHKNIIAFGDMLHKLHPLAGQGFNMTIRDVNEIFNLIKIKIENGLDLDTSICSDFEKNTKNRNYLFSNGIDLIYEFFNFENKINNNSLSKSVKFLGQNKLINNFFIKFADNGIRF